MKRPAEPIFHEDDIAELCAPKVFARGQKIFEDGALSETTRIGDELRALCEGSDLEPYRLSVKLTSQNIGALYCTCPYDYGGPCKHLVALLLAWVHTPEIFGSESALLPQLLKCERDELAQLIVQLVEIEPKLRAVVKRQISGALVGGVDEARQKIKDVMKRLKRAEWEADFREARRDLEFFTRQAAALQSQVPEQAGELFAVVLQELVSAVPELMDWDQDDEFSGLADDCAVGIGRCLEGSPSELRGRWLNLLLDAWVADLNYGGIGFGASADDALLSCNDDEWQIIEARLRERLGGMSNRRHRIWQGASGDDEDFVIDYTSDFNYETVINFLSERLRRTGRTTDAQKLLRDEGSPQQRATVLLELGEIDKALNVAKNQFARAPGAVMLFANQLYEVGHRTEALNYVAGKLRGEQYPANYLAWLAERTKADGPLNEGIKWHRQLFLAAPQTSVWDDLLALFEQSQSRDAMRQEMLQKLKKEGRNELLCDIALHEGDSDLALQLWKKLATRHQNERRAELARATEKTHPAFAIEQWTSLAENHIAARNRGAYQEAAKILRRVRDVYKNQNNLDEWHDFLAALRTEHKTLRALQDELEKAGL